MTGRQRRAHTGVRGVGRRHALGDVTPPPASCWVRQVHQQRLQLPPACNKCSGARMPLTRRCSRREDTFPAGLPRAPLNLEGSHSVSRPASAAWRSPVPRCGTPMRAPTGPRIRRRGAPRSRPPGATRQARSQERQVEMRGELPR